MPEVVRKNVPVTIGLFKYLGFRYLRRFFVLFGFAVFDMRETSVGSIFTFYGSALRNMTLTQK